MGYYIDNNTEPFWSVRIWENFVSEFSIKDTIPKWIFVASNRHHKHDGRWRGE